MSDEYNDYEVGHGKPPKHTRFQKGRSGNPTGRQKGAKSLAAYINAEWNAPILIRENDRSYKVTQGAVVAKRAMQQAMKGDHRAREFLLKYLPTIYPSEERHDPAAPKTEDQKADLEMLLAFAKRFKKVKPGDDK